MKTMGFVVSHKSGEKRRAVLPRDLGRVRGCSRLLFETGYGLPLGISDAEYARCGCRIVPREEALACDIVTDVKLGDADYLPRLAPGWTLFGWAHAAQDVAFTDAVCAGGHTVAAWENLYESGRYVFYRNREIAGEAAVLHGLPYSGKAPYDAKAAVIGNGMTAKGALRILHGLGARVDVYGRKLEPLFHERMFDYDVLVNCVFWNVSRTDHLISKEDVARMKPGTLIIDVSCDPHLGVETSHPTSIANPVYTVDGVIHYAVDNTPALFAKTASGELSACVAPYLDALLDGGWPESLKETVVIRGGAVESDEVRRFRAARGIPLPRTYRQG